MTAQAMPNDAPADAAIGTPVDAADLRVQADAALEADPTDGNAWTMLGISLRKQGRVEEAVAAHWHGIDHDPANAVIWTNLGNALIDLGRLDEAIVAHRQATSIAPQDRTLLFNLLVAQRRTGAFEDALQSIERLEALGHDSVLVRWERALTRLQGGDYAGGFGDYWARRQIPSYHSRQPPGALWDGSPLAGRRIFLSAEQGFGDALLVARHVAQVKAMGGHVIYECHPELRRILSALPADEFHPWGDPLPAYDVHASQMDLPGLFGTRIGSVPPPMSLHIPDDARDRMRALLGPADPSVLRVGIVWSGRTTFGENKLRATSLKAFLRLAEVPGVRLYSLQKGPPETELEESGLQRLIRPLGPHVGDFADTAAAVEQLDLIVMTDSSVAHLAASLGRPVWNLVQHVPYWIYGFEGETTPWYRSMRLFRQGRDRDWSRVFDRVAGALHHHAWTRQLERAPG